MRLITTGPPKSGTSLLRHTVTAMGYHLMPGAVIFDEWKRHESWVEENREDIPKAIVEQNIIRMSAARAYDALKEGWVLHGHIPPPTPPKIPTIVILREPRAAMVSWFRAKAKTKRGMTVTKPHAGDVRLFKRWLKTGQAKRACRYIKPIHDGWLATPRRKTLLIVRYETFFTDQNVQLIANFVGSDPIPLTSLYGQGSKYTGLPTEWQRWYDVEAEQKFRHIWERANLQSVSREGDGKDRRDVSGKL